VEELARIWSFYILRAVYAFSRRIVETPGTGPALLAFDERQISSRGAGQI
jgi:hypothetical protein